jgi:hypothetical protein
MKWKVCVKCKADGYIHCDERLPCYKIKVEAEEMHKQLQERLKIFERIYCHKFTLPDNFMDDDKEED